MNRQFPFPKSLPQSKILYYLTFDCDMTTACQVVFLSHYYTWTEEPNRLDNVAHDCESAHGSHHNYVEEAGELLIQPAGPVIGLY